MVDLTVAVLTYRRNADLAELLPLLLRELDGAAARLPGGGDVLVVDNDPEGGARAVVDAVGDARARYVVEPTPGIAAARNRALDESSDAALLAFIDDDERPVAGWLEALVETSREYSAAAVTGPVESMFDGELDPWIAAGGFYRRPHTANLTTGRSMPAAATNNVLLDLRVVRDRGLRFNVSLGMAGGEDTLFTRQLIASGARIVWCSEAKVTDRVPRERMTRRYVLRRMYGLANSSTLVDLALSAPGARGAVRRVRLGLVGAARVVGGGARALVGIALRRRSDEARGCAVAARGLGAVVAVLGHRHEQYRR